MNGGTIIKHAFFWICLIVLLIAFFGGYATCNYVI